MPRVTEIARILGCTGSNVCYLLRRGRIKGTRTSAGGWCRIKLFRITWPVREDCHVPSRTKFSKDRNSGIGLSWIQMLGKIKTARELPWSSVSVEKRKNLLSLICCMVIAGPAVAVEQNIPLRSSRKEEKRARKS